jgi:hypothetical protein
MTNLKSCFENAEILPKRVPSLLQDKTVLQGARIAE